MAIDTIKFKRGVKSKLNNLSYGEPAYISDENELYIGTEDGVEKITRNKEVAELSSQLEHIENIRNTEKINAITYNGIVSSDNEIDAIDITIPLQKLANEISFLTGNKKYAYFPKGYYKITDKIVLNRCGIVADNNAVFIFDGTNACFEFKPHSTQDKAYECFLEGLIIKGINGANTALMLNRCSQFYFERIIITGFDIGINIINSDISQFVRPSIQNCNTGVLINGLTGSTFEKGNFFANIIDVDFVGNSGCINFIANYFENSGTILNFDTSNGAIDISGLFFNNNMTVSNNLNPNAVLNGRFINVNHTHTTNTISVKNFVIDSNRILQGNTAVENTITIEGVGGNASNSFSMIISRNLLTNQGFLNCYPVKSNIDQDHQLQIIYEDNIVGGNNSFPLDGKGWVTGVDRTYSKQRFYNQLRGELIFEQPKTLTSMEGAVHYNKAMKTLQLHNGSGYQIIPNRAEYLANSTASDISTLRNDFNNLLQKLKDAKVMKTY